MLPNHVYQCFAAGAGFPEGRLARLALSARMTHIHTPVIATRKRSTAHPGTVPNYILTLSQGRFLATLALLEGLPFTGCTLAYKGEACS